MPKPLTLTLSLTDSAKCLTVKKEIQVHAGYPIDFYQVCDSLEEIQALIGIAKAQIDAPKFGPVPRCPICGKVMRYAADPVIVNPGDICSCPHPVDNSIVVHTCCHCGAQTSDPKMPLCQDCLSHWKDAEIPKHILRRFPTPHP